MNFKSDKIKTLVLYGLLLLNACTQESTDTTENLDFNVNVETAKDVEIIYSDSAQVRVKIVGATMRYYINTTEPQQEFPDGVRVDFYDAEQKVTSTLVGKHGTRYENKGEVIVRDSVVWKSVAGEQLDTEELIWDERKQLVYNHKFAVLRKIDEIIYGYNFEATQDFKNAKIKAVRGRKSVGDISKDFE